MPHGKAVALGLLAALRLSGLDDLADTVEQLLRPQRVVVDRERAWAALMRDKKVVDGTVAARPARRDPGSRCVGVEFEPEIVRSALDALDRVGSSDADRGPERRESRRRSGRRDPELYGGLGLSELETRIYEWALELQCTVRCRQTNHEGELIDWCHDAFDWADGVIVNPGAWSHYSCAIRDAVELFTVPVVEVHLSNILEREKWRQSSVLEES